MRVAGSGVEDTENINCNRGSRTSLVSSRSSFFNEAASAKT